MRQVYNNMLTLIFLLSVNLAHQSFLENITVFLYLYFMYCILLALGKVDILFSVLVFLSPCKLVHQSFLVKDNHVPVCILLCMAY